MGLTKQYLRYIPSGNFNIIASSGCNVVFLTLDGQEGRFVGVGACEDIVVWDMRLGEKVTYIQVITLFHSHL
jgi:U3 small nucleolar RNA-associated protein 12